MEILTYNEGTMDKHWETIGTAVESENNEMEIWYPENEVLNPYN